MTRARSMAAAAIVVVNAIVLFIASFDSIDWSDAQVGLVMLEATTITALMLAIYNHFLPATKRESVAIGSSLIAVAASTTGLLTGFQLWSLNDAQNSLLVGVVVAVIGLATAMFVREQVTASMSPPTDSANEHYKGNIDGEV